MKVTVTHTLNARFVEIASPSLQEFRDGEVFVRIETSVPDRRSFATVVCAGTADHPGPSNEAESLLAPHLLVDANEQPLAEQKEIRSAWFMIERVLQRVGKTLRWRFGIFGDNSVFSSTRLDVDLGDGAVLELTPMASAVMGDDIARIGPDGLREVAELVGASVEQPLAHELWRESGTSATRVRAAVSSSESQQPRWVSSSSLRCSSPVPRPWLSIFHHHHCRR